MAGNLDGWEDAIGRLREGAQRRERELSMGDPDYAQMPLARIHKLAASGDSTARRRAVLELERRRNAGTAPLPGAAPRRPPPKQAARKRRSEADYYAYVTRGQMRLFAHLIPRMLTAVDLLVFLDLMTRKRKGTDEVSASMAQVAKSIGRAKRTVQMSRKRMEEAGLLIYSCAERAQGTWDLAPAIEAAKRLAQGAPLFPPDEPPSSADEAQPGPHSDLPF